MKKNIWIVLAFFAPVLLYLAGSFIAVSFDIRDWDVGGRWMYVIYSLMASIFCLMAAND